MSKRGGDEGEGGGEGRGWGVFGSRNLAAQHLEPEPAACLGPAGAVSRHGIDNGMPGKLSGGEITVSSDRPGLQTPAGEHLLGKNATSKAVEFFLSSELAAAL